MMQENFSTRFRELKNTPQYSNNGSFSGFSAPINEKRQFMMEENRRMDIEAKVSNSRMDVMVNHLCEEAEEETSKMMLNNEKELQKESKISNKMIENEAFDELIENCYHVSDIDKYFD